MSLYDITEPEEKTKEIAVGIDLGTTFSLIAVEKDGAIEIIPHEGHLKLPSVVYYANQAIVGHEALKFKNKGAIFSIKRFIGSRDVESIKFNYKPSYELALQVSTDILKHMKKSAEEYLHAPITACVITVPAYFDDAARALTKEAAELAELKVLRMISEPTAAAIAYGMDQQIKGTIAVYDLGGGTFDVTILQMQQGILQVLATAGKNSLGGDDFDSIILDLIQDKYNLEQIEKSHSLLIIARNIREKLTNEALYNGIIQELDNLNVLITKEEFEQYAMPLFALTMQIFNKALKDADMDYSALDETLLVGGATRMPYIANMIKEATGKEPICTIDPDFVVVRGAAIQAARLSQSTNDGLLIDVIPLSLGIELADGSVEKIIHRNMPIPLEFKKLFTTNIDGQTSISIHVVQGEKPLASECRSLAKFDLRGIPPMNASIPRLEITFKIDADGLLTVEAKELISGIKQEIMVKPSFGVTSEEVTQYL